MKKVVGLSLGIVLFLSGICHSDTQTQVKVGTGNRKIIDKIVERVRGSLILLSDLKQPRLDKNGERYTLDEAIENELLFQEAARRKLLPTSLDLEKQILAWKEMRKLGHLSDREFDERMRSDGLTSEQFRTQLSRIFSIKRLGSLVISEEVVVTAREVEDYHKANPQHSEERYQLQTKIIPFSMAKTEADALKIEKQAEWIDSDWINKSQLFEKIAFVADMKVGEMSKPVKVEHGYQFVKLVKKEERHLRTLEERWGEIEKMLQQQKMGKVEDDLVKNLKDKWRKSRRKAT